jgi:hypothetical protein
MSDQVADITFKAIDFNIFSDATLILDDGAEVKVSRLLLAGASHVLRAVFTYDDNEAKIFKLGQVSSDGTSSTGLALAIGKASKII